MLLVKCLSEKEPVTCSEFLIKMFTVLLDGMRFRSQKHQAFSHHPLTVLVYYKVLFVVVLVVVLIRILIALTNPLLMLMMLELC